MGVAADCAYVATYGSQEKAATQILTNWNSASSLYKVCWTLLLIAGIFILSIYRAHLTSVLGLPNLKCEIKR
jgi:hypothetical protein